MTSAFGGTYRSRPQEEVLKELQALRPFEGAFTLDHCVFFVDDNIVSNRGYAGLFLGFETLSPETLAAVCKRVNRPNQYYDVVQKLHDHGIGIGGSFVFGFDTDDAGVFDRTLEFVTRAKLEVAYFSILTPYPGTRLHHRLAEERRILSQDWSTYDGSHVVYRPKTFTPEQLLDGYLRTWQQAYSVPTICRRLWGTTAWKSFFYPMNFGFRQSVRGLANSGGT